MNRSEAAIIKRENNGKTGQRKAPFGKILK